MEYDHSSEDENEFYCYKVYINMTNKTPEYSCAMRFFVWMDSPNFVASVFCSTVRNLERQGLDAGLLSSEEISKSFEYLNQDKLSKESIEIIFEQIMSGKAHSVEEAIEKTALSTLTEEELEEICNSIIENNHNLIDSQEARAIGPLMGNVMKQTRGKASGEKVNLLLQKKIKEYINKNSRK